MSKGLRFYKLNDDEYKKITKKEMWDEEEGRTLQRNSQQTYNH